MPRDWDSGGSWILNAWDAYGWIPTAVLSILFLGAVCVFVCWLLEDVALEWQIMRAPRAIFRWSRMRWRSKGPQLIGISQ